MTTYEEAGGVIDALVQKVMLAHHPELKELKVTVSAIIARRESRREGELPALKMHGLPIAAKTGITSLQDRSRGLADAKLVIDSYAWSRLSDTRKFALIDHELEHLRPITIRATKRNGYASGPRRDDLGRPCLKLRPHDWELTGFKDVVERQGEASIEAQQFMSFRAEYGQLNLFGPPGVIDGNGKKKGRRKAATEEAHGSEAEG